MIHNAFDGIPDVPLERFDLAFKGGTGAPLKLNRDVCHGPRQTVRARFTAHNGANVAVSTRLRSTAARRSRRCAPRPPAHPADRPRTRRRQIRRATLKLPTGLGRVRPAG